MARFSESLMAEFTSETLPVSIGPYSHSAPTPTKMFRWQGTHSALVEFLQKCARDNTDAGRSLARNQADLARQDSWAGLGEPPADFFTSGVSKAADKEFQAAVAKIHADRFVPGQLRAATAGGAWIVPLVLANSPMPARIRERTKLPPLNIDLGVTLMAMTPWKDLTRSLAPIAHAAWERLQAGGVVNLTTHYTWAFHAAQDGHMGVIVSVKAPLTNQAAFATAVSTQASRCFALLLGQSLSGVPDGRDSMPLAYWHKPGLHLLNGQGAGDKEVLKALRIG